jgi:hypothetical protein
VTWEEGYQEAQNWEDNITKVNQKPLLKTKFWHWVREGLFLYKTTSQNKNVSQAITLSHKKEIASQRMEPSIRDTHTYLEWERERIHEYMLVNINWVLCPTVLKFGVKATNSSPPSIKQILIWVSVIWKQKSYNKLLWFGYGLSFPQSFLCWNLIPIVRY